ERERVLGDRAEAEACVDVAEDPLLDREGDERIVERDPELAARLVGRSGTGELLDERVELTGLRPEIEEGGRVTLGDDARNHAGPRPAPDARVAGRAASSVKRSCAK